jgi:SRSO17 transposase
MDTERWGLSPELIATLGERLQCFWQSFRSAFKTRTHDRSAHALAYVSGLLRMKTDRNMAEIARQTEINEQSMQHFMSASPWSHRAVIEQVQAAVCARDELAGGVLILDESADAKAGEMSAGAGRQHNGRLGKIDQCQVGVFATYVHGSHWSWVDGALFLPQAWFAESHARQRAKAEIPAERVFQTKPQLAWELIEQAQQADVPFVAVTFDSLYGRSAWLRDQCHAARIEYYGDVPRNERVYLDKPQVDWPLTKRGVPSKKHRVTGSVYTVEQVANDPETVWETITLRPNARGMLVADFARRTVWTVRSDGRVVCETLLIRRDPQQITYSLSNADPALPLATLAQRKSARYFVERSIQDAKSELGWDEFQAIKYRAWQHQLALTILASWFIAETRLDWQRDHPPAPDLLNDYEMDELPSLSVANVRLMLRAAMPLPQLTPERAAELVVKHLNNRTRSRRSRLKQRYRRET